MEMVLVNMNFHTMYSNSSQSFAIDCILDLLGGQIPISNKQQSWQLHDCLGSIEFCSNNMILIMTSQIVVLFVISVIPMYVSKSGPQSSEVEIVASTCFVTVTSFALPQCIHNLVHTPDHLSQPPI
jgi:hypothetical protein